MSTRGFDERWQNAAIMCEHWHFYRQLYERYRVILEPGEFSRMIRKIRQGNALEVQKRARRRSIYAHYLRSGEIIYVLASRSMVYTAWPPSRAIRARREQLLLARKAKPSAAQLTEKVEEVST